MDSSDLRRLPRMDRLLAQPALADSGLPRSILHQAADEELSALRAGPGPVPESSELIRSILRRAVSACKSSLTPVVNATGIVLHTNLGRAPLAGAAVEAMRLCGLELPEDFRTVFLRSLEKEKAGQQ